MEFMKPEEAIELVKSQFPFPNYMDTTQDGCLNVAYTVLKYLQPGARVLDFGAGATDKTAVLQTLGFRCTACDDLQDAWHLEEDNRQKILKFADSLGIEFQVASDGALPFAKESYDMLMLHDVLEHLHDSPRDLINDLLGLVKPEGLLFVTVPNIVNIRKRLAVISGRTNLPDYSVYYWYPGHWRGHVREYAEDDLRQLAEFLALEIVELHCCHHMLHRIPRMARPPYLAVTRVFTSWRDTWSLVAQKKQGWTPRKALSSADPRKLKPQITD